MNNNTFHTLKKIFIILIITSIFVIISILFISLINNKFIKDIKSFTNSGTKVLYISDEANYSSYPISIFDKYEVEYLYISKENLSNFEQSKLKKIINSQYLSNIIVIFENGKIIDAIIDYETEDHLNKFLQVNNIIPKVIGDIEGIIDSTKSLLETDLTLIYIPYNYIEGIDQQNEILKELTKQYNINYKMINAYLLSNNQKLKLNNLLQVSNVIDQIVILVKDKKIVGSIRGKQDKEDYLNDLYKYNFIKKSENHMNEINYDKFIELINSNDKNIITIIKDDCKYCGRLVEDLNNIIVDYGITINYINIGDIDSELSKKINYKLNELEYLEGFTTPLTIIVESNKLLDFVIGTSSEDYLIDIFKVNGIIKEVE